MEKILLVNINKNTLDIITHPFNYISKQYEIVTAQNLTEIKPALAKIKAKLLVIDIHKPTLQILNELLYVIKNSHRTTIFVIYDSESPEIIKKLKKIFPKYLFKKPIDKNNLQEKIKDLLTSAIGGKVHGISLPAFLQMSEMDKTTCTLKIKSSSEEGILYIISGNLIAAKTKKLSGEKAAYEIISWDNTSIEIEKAVKKKKKEIQIPLMTILMEALKIKDEKAIDKEEGSEKEIEPLKEISISTIGDLFEKENTEEKNTSKASESTQKPLEKKRKKRIPVILVFIITTFAVSVALCWNDLIKPKIEQYEYQKVLKKTGTQKDLAEMEKLLVNYIISHKESKFTENAKNKIKEIKKQIHEKDYNTVLTVINKLPKDNMYESKANTIYGNYINKYPDDPKSDIFKQKMSETYLISDKYDYDNLEAVKKNDFSKRVNLYKAYILNHPSGKYSIKVKNLLSEVQNGYYNEIKSKIKKCILEKNWDSCINACNDYLLHFDNSKYKTTIITYLNNLKYKKAYEALYIKAKEKEERNDIVNAKDILSNYLELNPKTTEKKKILYEIKRIGLKISSKYRWEQTLTYTMNSANSISNRIKKIEKAIREDKTDGNLQMAKEILKDLQNDRKKILKKIKNKKNKKYREKQKLAKIRQEKKRVELETKKVAALINKAKSRYKISNNNTTVIDTKTGLMWCLLDSLADLNKCIDYETSVSYANNLKTGGYSDWRLPSTSELVVIYKNRPFFPKTKAAWYWSSEMFSKGWNKKANIVTTNQNIYTNKIKKQLNQCGFVRAVRP